MIEYVANEGVLPAVISGAVTLFAVIATHWLRGKTRLIAFSPNSSFFQFVPPNPEVAPINIRSSQIMVQNLGRLPAENVEIISETAGEPAGYNMIPAVDFEVGVTSSGRWLVRIPYIAPKEVVTLQILNGANIEQVRCKGGVAKFVPVVHQRLYPGWIRFVTASLMIVGVFSIVYWLMISVI